MSSHSPAFKVTRDAVILMTEADFDAIQRTGVAMVGAYGEDEATWQNLFQADLIAVRAEWGDRYAMAVLKGAYVAERNLRSDGQIIEYVRDRFRDSRWKS